MTLRIRISNLILFRAKEFIDEHHVAYTTSIVRMRKRFVEEIIRRISDTSDYVINVSEIYYNFSPVGAILGVKVSRRDTM